MLMCPKQEQTANCSQVEIEILIVKGRNLPRTNSTKYELKIFLEKNSRTSTPHQKRALTFSLKENKCLLCIFINNDNLAVIHY